MYLASAETGRNLLFPTATVHHECFPAESVHLILLPVGRKHNNADSLGRTPFSADSSHGRKQEIADSSAEAKYDRQSRQEVKIGGLVYIL